VSDVTGADREKAAEVVEKIAGVPWDVFTEAEWGWAGHIAEALADERAKARAPFLALADMVEQDALETAEPDDPDSAEHVRACALLFVAHSISRAAEDPS